MSRRIVVVGPVAPLRGGIAAHSARLVEALVRAGWAAEVVSYSRLYPKIGFPGTSQFVSRAVDAGTDRARADGSGHAECRRTPRPREGTCEREDAREDRPPAVALIDTLDPRTWAAAAAAVSRPSPARVIVQWWHPVTAPALARVLRDVPRSALAVVCHNPLPHERFPLAAMAARRTLGRAGLVVCHGRAVAERVRRLLPTAPVESVAMPPLIDPALGAGVGPSAAGDLSQAAGIGGVRAWAAARFGLPAEGPLVVMAGHMRSYKGADVLVDAWKRRPPSFRPGARLLLVGECYLRGRERRRLFRQIEADPSIVLVNRYVDDAELVRLVSIAAVLAFPYRSATQSGILPLARALGVPCVVSDAGALPEQAPRARVVRSGDATSLCAALAEATGRPADAPGAGARAGGEGAGSEAVEAFEAQWRRVVEVACGGVRP